MENPVLEVRKLLGETQIQFARRIGKSYATLRLYERGTPVPPDVLERLKILREQFERPSIAPPPDSEPGQVLISHRRLDPIRFMEKNRRWHELLEKVLNSRTDLAVDAVTRNLEAFALTVDLQESNLGHSQDAAARPDITGRAALFDRIEKRADVNPPRVRKPKRRSA